MSVSKLVGSRLAKASSHMKPLARGFAGGSAAPQVSAVDRLFNYFSPSKMPRVGLSEAFDSKLQIPSNSAFPPVAAPQISTLPNGLRVVSTENYSPISSVGVFVDAGSRYEISAPGASHFLEQLAVKSTNSRSGFQLVKDMAVRGGNLSSSASRENIFYAGEILRDDSLYLVDTLGDIVTNGAFDSWEIEDLIESKKHPEGEPAPKNPDADILDAIHAAAFGNRTLGLPVVPSSSQPYAYDHITPDFLKDFVANHFVPSRIVVAGVGIDHSALVNRVQRSFARLSSASTGAEKEAAVYVGGDVRSNYDTQDGLVHLAIAFQAPSLHDKDLVPLCVLQMMMGGGLSFSAGGPGKGMYTRLYERVLNRYHWAQSANCFTSLFSDSSLFGVYGTSTPDAASDLALVIATQLKRMAQNISDIELARARNQLKSSVSMHLESRSCLLEDMGRQTLLYGKVETSAELCDRVDSVTKEDLERVAASLLSSTPSVAAVGDISNLPRYDAIVKHFN